ncbi:hypothetical protein ACOI1C_03425 [Bacillus sp. DJP31]|uniref:hypothetical protein n=1 Tax=Bacillus sp. DJP31 TaxID=3409789 RepID=UPI003BB56F17
MDKPKVSIKINGIKRSFYETTSDKHEQVNPQDKVFPSTSRQTEHVYQEKKAAHDEPSLAKDEIAAANEEREFDWVLPQQSQNTKDDWAESIVTMDELRKKRNTMFDPIYVPSKQKIRKNETFPIKTLFLAIISALVIGTSFGMMVLQMFTGTQEQSVTEPKQPAQAVTTPEVNGGGEDTKGQERQPILGSVPVLNVFVVQGGVYSSEAAVTPIVEEIKSKGLAGKVVTQDGKYYLFLGIGASDQAAKAIRTPYEAHVEGAFVKNLSTPELNGDTSILQARQLFDQLVSYTSNLYGSLPESMKWEEVSKTNEIVKSKDSNSTVDSFLKSVKESYTLAEAYKTSSSSQDFWATQQSLLNSYQIYQKWILEQKIE